MGNLEVSNTIKAQLTLTGDVATLRFFFAFFRLDECNRDVSPSEWSQLSSTRYLSLTCLGVSHNMASRAMIGQITK